MARRRRSLLGKKSKATALPSASRAAVPPRGEASKDRPEEAPPPEASAAAEDAAPAEDHEDEQPTVADEADEGGEASSDADAPPPAELQPDVQPPDDDIEDQLETEIVTTRPRGFDDPVELEDDDPLIGDDLTIPPRDEDDDAISPPREVLANLHARGMDPADDVLSQPTPPPTDDELVLFDERPDDEAEAAESSDPVYIVDEHDPQALMEEDDGTGADAPLPEDEPPEGEPSLVSIHPSVSDEVDDDPIQPELPISASGRSALDAPTPPGVSPSAPPAPADDGFLTHEDGDPPTEEAPAGMLAEDFAALYSAPMDVPDAPVMPGILGKETPAGIEERPVYKPVKTGGAPAPEVTSPRGLWDETPLPSSGRDATEEDEEDAAAPAPPPYIAPPPPKDEEVPFYMDTWFLVACGLAAVAAIAVLITGFIVMGPGGGPDADGVVPNSNSGLRAPDVSRPPIDLIPRDGDTTEDPDGDNTESSISIVPDELETDAPEAAPEPPLPAPTTRRGTRRDPAPTPTTSTPPEAAKTGRLKIRAARKTLIYVNGKPVGMTPLDLDRPAGKYEISGEVEGQMRVERVDLSSGTIRLVDL